MLLNLFHLKVSSNKSSVYVRIEGKSQKEWKLLTYAKAFFSKTQAKLEKHVPYSC
jgi:hypothetical protein